MNEDNLLQPKESVLRRLMKYLPVAVITAVWCIAGSNLAIELHDYVMMNTVFVALLVVFSTLVLKSGKENVGFFGLTIGISTYFGSIIIRYSLPLFPEYTVLQILAFVNILGAAISLYAAVSLGLWLSNTRIDPRETKVKYIAYILTAVVLLSWFIAYFAVVSAIILLPGVELLFYIGLILLSGIFIPRRQNINIFYFTIGLALVMWGLLVLTRAVTADAFLFGSGLRIFGTFFLILFALPIAAGSVYYKDQPETTLYMVITIWFLLEILLAAYMYPFSPIRVFAIAAIIILSLKNLKSHLLLPMFIGLLISTGLAIAGIYIFIEGQLSIYPVTLLYVGLGLIIVSTSLLIFCVLSLGESIRVKIEGKKPLLLGLGALLILGGVTIGIAALSLLLEFAFYLDLIFLILIGLGSMLVVIKPSRVIYILFAFSAVLAASIVFTEYLFTIPVIFYIALALMIFTCVQQYRLDLET